jgi:hypothetical protein
MRAECSLKCHGKELFVRQRRSWKNNIKIDVEDVKIRIELYCFRL